MGNRLFSSLRRFWSHVRRDKTVHDRKAGADRGKANTAIKAAGTEGIECREESVVPQASRILDETGTSGNLFSESSNIHIRALLLVPAHCHLQRRLLVNCPPPPQPPLGIDHESSVLYADSEANEAFTLSSSSNHDHLSQPPTDSEIYARQLLPKLNGYPLWNPDVSWEKQKRSVSIGDVGYIDIDGRFHYLFNILYPADDPRNGPHRVPPTFEPLSNLNLGTHTHKYPNQYGLGAFVCSPQIEVRSLHPKDIQSDSRFWDISQWLVDGLIPEEVGYGYRITGKRSEGAILILPDGAARTDFLDEDRFEEYAYKNAISWYIYANGQLGRCIGGNSLMLVTGLDKAKTWGVASYTCSEPNTVQMDFVPGIRAATKYRFRNVGSATANTGPTRTPSDAQDQCVFVRGIRVAVRERGLHVDARSMKSMSSQEVLYRSKSTPFRYHFIDEDHWVVVPDQAGQQDLQLKTTLRPPYHPAAVINEHLLNSYPEIDTAVTHDKQWFGLLGDGEDIMPDDQELIGRLERKFDVVPIPSGPESVFCSSTCDLGAQRSKGTNRVRLVPKTSPREDNNSGTASSREIMGNTPASQDEAVFSDLMRTSLVSLPPSSREAIPSHSQNESGEPNPSSTSQPDPEFWLFEETVPVDIDQESSTSSSTSSTDRESTRQTPDTEMGLHQLGFLEGTDPLLEMAFFELAPGVLSDADRKMIRAPTSGWSSLPDFHLQCQSGSRWPARD
ncbi:hypothetical protein VNI00_011578 [Paramarasmius palmivorus]|uniref:Uncharacterized protein n=1 Tax=Paramarasmius palmivorus TaxID=297713 RepID=A0AAW0CB48_9AGAR